MIKTYITHISGYVPEGHLSNEELAAGHPEWHAEKISEKTGIWSRPISAPGEFASDMAVAAAEKLFLECQIPREKIDYLLLCTQSPDYFLPTTACILQDRLGLPKNCGATDFNMGCSGYVYGLGLAKGLVATGQARRVLMITSETFSKMIHPDDRNNKTIFGDAASATLISPEPLNAGLNGEIREFTYHTDGSGFDKLIVKNHGIRFMGQPGTTILDDEGNFVRNDDFLYMDGKAIFTFTLFSVPPLVEKALAANNLTMDDIGLAVFHQANEYMLQAVRVRCRIPAEKFFIHLKDTANTGPSTIPLALQAAAGQKVLRPGMNVLLAGFGVGLSAGVTVIRY